MLAGQLRRWHGALAAAAVALTLGACATRIWRDEADPEGVRLHWYTNQVSIDEARGEAARYCQARDKHAVLRDEFIDRDVTVARFVCL